MKLFFIILSSNRQETLQWRTPSATTRNQNLKNFPSKHLNCILTTKINLSFIFPYKLVSSMSTFPPFSPLGAWTRLLKRILTITRRLNFISLRRPSPPLWNPSPPLFCLSPNLCRITGYLCSKISGSVTLVALYYTSPIPSRTSSTSTSNGFILTKGIISKCKIIHTSLWTSRGLNVVNITSVILCDVRTLPPTTTAVSLGERNEPSGIRIFTGAKQPWLRGISTFTKQRTQYMINAVVTASGAFQLP